MGNYTPPSEQARELLQLLDYKLEDKGYKVVRETPKPEGGLTRLYSSAGVNRLLTVSVTYFQDGDDTAKWTVTSKTFKKDSKEEIGTETVEASDEAEDVVNKVKFSYLEPSKNESIELNSWAQSLMDDEFNMGLGAYKSVLDGTATPDEINREITTFLAGKSVWSKN